MDERGVVLDFRAVGGIRREDPDRKRMPGSLVRRRVDVRRAERCDTSAQDRRDAERE
jgi:hypothetical protein